MQIISAFNGIVEYRCCVHRNDVDYRSAILKMHKVTSTNNEDEQITINSEERTLLTP